MDESGDRKRNRQNLPAAPAAQPVLHEQGRAQATASTGQQTVTVQAQYRSGPLPSPSEFADYEAVLPGAADRLLTLAEQEQRFRHDAIVRDQKAESAFTLIGQVSALLVALAFGWWSYRLIDGGHQVAGTVLALSDLAVLVGLFLRRGEGADPDG